MGARHHARRDQGVVDDQEQVSGAGAGQVSLTIDGAAGSVVEGAVPLVEPGINEDLDEKGYEPLT